MGHQYARRSASLSCSWFFALLRNYKDNLLSWFLKRYLIVNKSYTVFENHFEKSHSIFQTFLVLLHENDNFSDKIRASRIKISLCRYEDIWIFAPKFKWDIWRLFDNVSGFKRYKRHCGKCIEDPFFTRKEFYWEFHGGAKLKWFRKEVELGFSTDPQKRFAGGAVCF